MIRTVISIALFIGLAGSLVGCSMREDSLPQAGGRAASAQADPNAQQAAGPASADPEPTVEPTPEPTVEPTPEPQATDDPNAWSDIELSDDDKKALAEVTLGGFGIRTLTEAKSARYDRVTYREQEKNRDFLQAVVEGTTKQASISIEAGEPTLSGGMLSIPKKGKVTNLLGYMSSLPADGDQFALTFDVDVPKGTMTEASKNIAKQVAKTIARQKQAREDGKLKEYSFGRVQWTDSIKAKSLNTTAIHAKLLDNGATLGDGPTIVGWADYVYEKGELVGIKGVFRGKRYHKKGKKAFDLDFSATVDTECYSVGECGDKLGDAIVEAATTQTTANAAKDPDVEPTSNK